MSELDTGGLNVGRIETRELEAEMRSSFLDYAMSTIVARALPDVRDGLKPVHRRVPSRVLAVGPQPRAARAPPAVRDGLNPVHRRLLYAMSERGLQPGRPRVKCARVVGEVMGNYH